MERIATTPFGGARMCAEIFSLQSAVAKRQSALRQADAGNDAGTADKWQILRALAEAREAYGLSDRTIAVLEALASFHPSRLLDGRNPIIVFPSNAELALRARGMSAPTLRRHLALLVGAGLILRRDSANGKRFCRRDEQGGVEIAFGFDLAPLALMAGDIHEKAEQARATARAIQAVRMEIALHLRDIAKIVDAAVTEERSGDWSGMAERLQALSGRISRTADMQLLTSRRDTLIHLRADVENTYLESLSQRELSANDADFERHIQDSKTEQLTDKSSWETRAVDGAARQLTATVAEPRISLEDFLKRCPDFTGYSIQSIQNWQDVRKTADLVRSVLGISPNAWVRAMRAMGDRGAAMTLAAILQRGETIRSPGGYLRELTAKAERGRFTVQPMLHALAGSG